MIAKNYSEGFAGHFEKRAISLLVRVQIDNPDQFEQVFDTYYFYEISETIDGRHFDHPSSENVHISLLIILKHTPILMSTFRFGSFSRFRLISIFSYLKKVFSTKVCRLSLCDRYTLEALSKNKIQLNADINDVP